jgi:hypothetical protein
MYERCASTQSVENFVEIASQHVTTFCRCNTSSKLHSPAALPDSLFDQSFASMKQKSFLRVRGAALPPDVRQGSALPGQDSLKLSRAPPREQEAESLGHYNYKYSAPTELLICVGDWNYKHLAPYGALKPNR